MDPRVLELVGMLPESAQEAVQQAAVKAMSDKYYVALATVPAAYLLAYVPHFIGVTVKVLTVGPREYNNDTPRTEEPSKYPKTLARCVGAHQNALEMFPSFAAAVLLAKVQKADPKRVTALAVQHLKLRFYYTLLYVFGFHKFINAARTAVWGQAMMSLLELYGASLF
jgi:uncharacterized MAPEG superfamily protein